VGGWEVHDAFEGVDDFASGEEFAVEGGEECDGGGGFGWGSAWGDA
jgi:hypothetical protein